MVRYEGRTELHHHLICLRCDQVIDISDDHLDGCPLPDTSKLGFEVKDHRVQLRGICRRCREEEIP
jgi:Fe2+ or Zn2+ uptake regulation protein